MSNRSEKKKQKKWDWRNGILWLLRLLFLVVYPVTFSTGFSGVKFIVMQMREGRLFTWNTFTATALVLLLFSVVFGRFFCGFACGFGTYSDLVYALSCRIRKKQKKRPLAFPPAVQKYLRYLKYVVVTGILLLVFFGFSMQVSQYSPWTVFSRLSKGAVAGIGFGGAVLFVLVTVGMFWEQRFFCRYLCPFGALFSLLPVIPYFSVKRNRPECIKGCAACQNICPAHIAIASTDGSEDGMMGECFSCGRCVGICPKSNVSAGPVSDKKYMWILQLLKGVLLFIVLAIAKHL